MIPSAIGRTFASSRRIRTRGRCVARGILVGFLAWLPSLAGATVAPNCEAAAVRVGSTAEESARAAELLRFITLTDGFALEALASTKSDLAFAQTLFLATGYSLPGPKGTWWGLDARITGIHWSVFRAFAENQRKMHADLRKTWRSGARAAYANRLMRNLDRFRKWQFLRNRPFVDEDDMFIALWDDKSGTTPFRPATNQGILDEKYHARLRRVLGHLTNPEVHRLVGNFIAENLRAVADNHFELANTVTHEMGPEPNDHSGIDLARRPAGLTVANLIASRLGKVRLGPSETVARTQPIPEPNSESIPARSKTSEEIAQFLLHPNRLANGGGRIRKLSFMDIEFEIRTVLAFVTSIQNHVSRVPTRGPEWTRLAASYDARAEWLESLEHHLDIHRQLGFERSKVLDQARIDLISVNQWLERQRRAVIEANEAVKFAGGLDAVGARDLMTVHALLPRLDELASGAADAIDSKIEIEAELRKAMQNVELILSKTIQARLLNSADDPPAEELETALHFLAGAHAN